MAERVFLEIGGRPAGECDAETFEIVKIYLSEGRKEVDVVRELAAGGTLCKGSAIVIIVNAKRELGLLRGSSKESCQRG